LKETGSVGRGGEQGGGRKEDECEEKILEAKWEGTVKCGWGRRMSRRKRKRGNSKGLSKKEKENEEEKRRRIKTRKRRKQRRRSNKRETK